MCETVLYCLIVGNLRNKEEQPFEDIVSSDRIEPNPSHGGFNHLGYASETLGDAYRACYGVHFLESERLQKSLLPILFHLDAESHSHLPCRSMTNIALFSEE